MKEAYMAGLDDVRECIEKGNYEEAEKLLDRYKEQNGEYNDIAAILDGSIGAWLMDRDRQWQAIRRGLQYNNRNAELYVMLGNYYLEENLQKACLCYENALHWCEEEEDSVQIQRLIRRLKEAYGVQVPKTAIIILSYNLLDYTRQCIESIRETIPESAREIIVVDNASRDGSVDWLRRQHDLILIENKENKGFPAGCNQGIRAAGEDCDIFLLNNDTIMPPNALFWLRMGLYENAEVGAVGSVSNYVANGQQIANQWKTVEEILAFADTNNVPMEYPYEEKLFLIGFALLVKRSVVDEVGLLDEIFSPGNSEDVDYGLRVLKAGYRNLLCRNSFILHFGSKSFGKLGQGYAQILHKNQGILNKKWGMNLQYYMSPRMELVNLIQSEKEKPLHVLDIGCGCGAIMAKVKSQYPHAVVNGIELVESAAGMANTIGEVLCGDVEQITFPYPEEYFDCCIMGDVLEHLREPGKVLERLRRHIKWGGHIIVSMPNMKHWSVILPLLRYDVFPYADAGILDRTHLKMYTKTEIQRLILNSGYQLEIMQYISAGEPSQEEKEQIEHLLKLMAKPDRTSFFAYQYLVKAVKR